jgi:hypothetical protein
MSDDGNQGNAAWFALAAKPSAWYVPDDNGVPYMTTGYCGEALEWKMQGKQVLPLYAAAGASNERADANPDAVLRAYRQGVEDATAFPYQKTFDAIAAATSISCGTIAISVIKFREVFGLLSGASNERADADTAGAKPDMQAFAEKVRNGIADYVADNMPDRKHSLEEIDLYIRKIEINADMLAATPASSVAAAGASNERADAAPVVQTDAEALYEAWQEAINTGTGVVKISHVTVDEYAAPLDKSAERADADTAANSKLLALHKELNKIIWAGADEGWDKAIEAVRDRIMELVK